MKKGLFGVLLICIFCSQLFAQSPSETTGSSSVYPQTPDVVQDYYSSGVSSIGSFDGYIDNAAIGKTAEIEDFAVFSFSSFSFVDSIRQYNEGSYSESHVFESGAEAQYAVFKVDIVNRTKQAVDFLSDVYVKVVYDDEYAFEGWSYQYNFDASSDIVLSRKDQFGIMPMYSGHYVFGCTLPNSVVESYEPLEIIITINGVEITYKIR